LKKLIFEKVLVTVDSKYPQIVKMFEMIIMKKGHDFLTHVVIPILHFQALLGEGHSSFTKVLARLVQFFRETPGLQKLPKKPSTA